MMFFKQKTRKVPYRRRDVDWEKLLDRSWSHYPHVPVLQFALDIHRLLLFLLANTSKFVFVHCQNIEKHHRIFSRGEHRNSLQLNAVLTLFVCFSLCECGFRFCLVLFGERERKSNCLELYENSHGSGRSFSQYFSSFCTQF